MWLDLTKHDVEQIANNLKVLHKMIGMLEVFLLAVPMQP